MVKVGIWSIEWSQSHSLVFNYAFGSLILYYFGGALQFADDDNDDDDDDNNDDDDNDTDDEPNGVQLCSLVFN